MKPIVTLSLLLMACPALAQDGQSLSYEIFETAIAHVNLESCPAELAAEGRFCRMTMNNDAMHVFAFDEAGEQGMVGLRTYYMDELSLAFD